MTKIRAKISELWYCDSYEILLLSGTKNGKGVLNIIPWQCIEDRSNQNNQEKFGEVYLKKKFSF